MAKLTERLSRRTWKAATSAITSLRSMPGHRLEAGRSTMIVVGGGTFGSAIAEHV